MFLEQAARRVANGVENGFEYPKALEDRDKETTQRQRFRLKDESRAHSGAIVGESPALKAALQLVCIVAPTDSSVLILGGDRDWQGVDRPRDPRSERPPRSRYRQVELCSDSARAPGE